VAFFVPHDSRQPENKWWQITTKHKEYVKAASNFSINLRAKINEIDRERIADTVEISAKIKILKDKYYAVSHQASSKYIKDFTSFVMDEKISPSDNWVKIHLLRKEAHRHSGSTRFDDNFMWNTLLMACDQKMPTSISQKVSPQHSMKSLSSNGSMRNGRRSPNCL
jgi:hypothetical protein